MRSHLTNVGMQLRRKARASKRIGILRSGRVCSDRRPKWSWKVDAARARCLACATATPARVSIEEKKFARGIESLRARSLDRAAKRPIDFPFTAEQVVLMGRAPFASSLFESDEDRYHVAARHATHPHNGAQGSRLSARSAAAKNSKLSWLRPSRRCLPLYCSDEPAAFLDVEHQIGLYRLLRTLFRLRRSRACDHTRSQSRGGVFQSRSRAATWRTRCGRTACVSFKYKHTQRSLSRGRQHPDRSRGPAMDPVWRLNGSGVSYSSARP